MLQNKGQLSCMPSHGCTILIAGLIHMPRNYMGIKCTLASENDSRLFSMVGFHLKISADLHEFTSKMQITVFPNGEQKERWRQLPSSFISKAEVPSVFRVENAQRCFHQQLHTQNVKHPIMWTQVPLCSLAAILNLASSICTWFIGRRLPLSRRVLTTQETEAVLGGWGAGVLLFQRKPWLGSKW